MYDVANSILFTTETTSCGTSTEIKRSISDVVSEWALGQTGSVGLNNEIRTDFLFISNSVAMGKIKLYCG